jgi:hypothetical protein
MAYLFDALPGIEVPVGSIAKGLMALWIDAASAGKPAPDLDDSRATQINLILHLGYNTTFEDAKIQFSVATRFAMRYLSRVVVLCPIHDDDTQATMRAKVYGECTLGKSKLDKRCCEFVILSYTKNQRQYLESEVSVCISSDLPLYYWPHRFASNAALADYRYFLTKANRILIDSATSPKETLSYPWPRPEAVRDLAQARLLHVRQAIGQFLSRYLPETLTANLTSVCIEHGNAFSAEGHIFLNWVKDRMVQCGAHNTTFELKTAPDSPDYFLSLKFNYKTSDRFVWTADLKVGQCHFDASFDKAATHRDAAIKLLGPDDCLSEAMFF